VFTLAARPRAYATNNADGESRPSVSADNRNKRRAAVLLDTNTQLLEMAAKLAGLGHWHYHLPSGRIVWSEETYRIHGIAQSEAEPDYAALLKLYEPECAARLSSLVERAIATGGSYEFEGVIRRPDGAVRNVAAKAQCRLEADGKVKELFGVFQDVTAQRETELHLKEANDITRRALVTAENALLAKQAFLANISHELRNPLTGVIGFSELMFKEGRLDTRSAEHLAHIRSASEALLRTIDDLLSISRLDAQQLAIEPAPVDPHAIAAEALRFHAPQLDDKKLTAEFLATGLPTLVMLDAGRVRQILTNFITNAAKFTAEGGITLRAAYDDVRELLTFEVQDTGCGIAPEHHAKIFQRFSQVDRSLGRRHAGAGLGLSICKGLAKAMGGEISFESRANEGSCFRVVLPAPKVAESVCHEREPVGHTGVEPLRGLRILVVDDHQMNRLLVRQMLEPFELDVVDAGNAHEAAGIAAARPFDLILLDLMMPDIDGVATVPLIRACNLNRETPIVAFSALAQGDIPEESAALFSGVLAKPIAARELLDLLLRFAPSG
jgi:signal transduction histidine kinase/CheY-like chemotaxis protein